MSPIPVLSARAQGVMATTGKFQADKYIHKMPSGNSFFPPTVLTKTLPDKQSSQSLSQGICII